MPLDDIRATDVILPGSMSDMTTPDSSEVEEPINILLVDDEPKNLMVLETILNHPRYRLVPAETADQALLALVSQEFALIVLDIQMPGMTGFELAHMIKQRKKTSAVPIIFLTAYYSEDQHVLEGYETGAVDYLHKPVNPTILRSKVAVFAELHRKTRDSAHANRILRAEASERIRVQEKLLLLNNELEQRVEARTGDLLRANRALRESEAFARSLVESSADCVQVLTLDGRLQWMNENAKQMLGTSASDDHLVNNLASFWEANLLRAEAENAMLLARNGGVGRFRGSRPGPDGTPRWWDVLITPIPGHDGVPERLLAISRDVTEQRRNEEALKEAGRRKDEFLAMLSHELRNPLAPLSNAVHILRLQNSKDPHQTAVRDVIERQVTHLVRLVDDLLDVSRVSRGKIQLRKEPLDLTVVVRRAEEMSRALIESRKHHLTVNLPNEAVSVEGDLTRLTQVISNLLDNAAKYTDDGGKIWVALEKGSERVLLSVRDSGRGLDTETLANVFDLFYQADRNLDRSEGGLGIGLSLVKSIVQMHGGTVQAYSEGRGKGSEFVVSLPCLRSAAPHSAKRSPESCSPRASRLRVLVVDDNQDSARSMALLFELEDHEVLTAFDGKAAVEIALREKPNLILMDIGLPGLNGYQACQAMRAGGLKDALIVATTGYGQAEDRQQSRQAGFDAHLVKPVDVQAIRELVIKSAGSKP
jgi:PAS domain S-box-containing protein